VIEENPPLGAYTTPAQELELLRGRVLIITGVGRSGTTILGKLVGSMHPAYYFFEPAAMKYLPFLLNSDPGQAQVYASMARSLLSEDYLLPTAQGRSLNFNPGEDSYVGHYLPLDEVKQTWGALSRRGEIVEKLRKKRPCWIIKTTEFQALFSAARTIFPEARFLHVIRNGNDVVSSALKRGWYTDRYMNREIVDWVQLPKEKGASNIPWYLDEESKECFANWNQTTRAACIWRCLTEVGMAECQAHPDDCQQLTYEELVRQPQVWVETFSQSYGLAPTELTQRHIASVRDYQLSVYPSIIDQVQTPERNKFAELMRGLGYGADD
jgi:hypothetical protein